jgi:hypothetical protein
MFFPWTAGTARVFGRRHGDLSGFILHGSVFINTDVSSVAFHAVYIVLERKRNSLPALQTAECRGHVASRGEFGGRSPRVLRQRTNDDQTKRSGSQIDCTASFILETDADRIGCADLRSHDQTRHVHGQRRAQHHVAQGNAWDSYGIGVACAVRQTVGV